MQDGHLDPLEHEDESQARGFKLMGAVERHKSGRRSVQLSDAELNTSTTDDDQMSDENQDTQSWFSVLKQRAETQDQS